jgi:hypothetical protein
MRLALNRAARSFSVPRKSPGRSRLAKSASRTSATTCAESDDDRPASRMRAVALVFGFCSIGKDRLSMRLRY